MITFGNTITVEDYCTLRKSAGWRKIEDRQAQTGLNNSAYITVASDGIKTVGMARVVSDGGYIALIADVIVLPEYQSRGIGRALMHNVVRYIEDTLSEGQCVMVNLMAAKGKEGFYEKFGFVVRPNDSVGAGMHRWVEGHANSLLDQRHTGTD